MAKQLILLNGKYYFVDEETLEILELHVDKPVIQMELQREILKAYIKGNRGDNARF